jgi:RsiW-degrading membrane proteinase PrsW (M82 family)
MNTGMINTEDLMLWVWSVGPSILIISVIYFFDKFKEPKAIVLTSFLLGYGLMFFLDPLIIFTEGVINYFKFPYPESEFYFAYTRAAFLEETCKLLILYYYCSRQHAFNERMDAIVYGVTVSLGFSAMENIDYVFRYSSEMQNIIYVRILPTIMHASTGAVMGLILGGFFIKNIPLLFRMVLALFIPIIIHGTYNLMWGLGHIIIGYVIVLSLILSTAVILYRQKEHQKLKKEEEEYLIKHPNYYMGYSIFINLFTIIIFSMMSSKLYYYFYDKYFISTDFDFLQDLSLEDKKISSTTELIGLTIYNPNSECTISFDSEVEAYSECFANLYESLYIGEDNYLYIGPYDHAFYEKNIEEAYILENGEIISWYRFDGDSDWSKDNLVSYIEN